LYETLAWLTDEGGHRRIFESLGQQVAPLSDKEYQDFLETINSNPKLKHQAEVARKYYNNLGSKGILGWDYCRFICLCRWGYACGYLTKKEAWLLMMPIAVKLQKTFSSWEELGNNYLIGRSFWSLKYTQSEGNMYEQILKYLLTNTSSPWTQLQWNMNLENGLYEIANDPNL
jgi:hypothetical protein